MEAIDAVLPQKGTTPKRLGDAASKIPMNPITIPRNIGIVSLSCLMNIWPKSCVKMGIAVSMMLDNPKVEHL